MVGLLFEETAAAGFEFFVRTADAVVFHAGQGRGWVDEIPVVVDFDEGG